MKIEKQTYCKLNGYQLKLIAVITMLIDHIGAVLLGDHGSLPDGGDSVITALYYLCRMVGRLAFPLFCFLLTEGFFYSKNRYRYVGRMMVFAVVSLWPFYIAFDSYGNVLITFTIALLTMVLIEAVRNRMRENQKIFLIIVIGGIGYLFAELLHSDYGGIGVVAILLLYFFHAHPILSYVISVVFLGTFLDSSVYIALVGAIFLYSYNGERGEQTKYFFYFFYPIHLVLLVIIKWYLLS